MTFIRAKEKKCVLDHSGKTVFDPQMDVGPYADAHAEIKKRTNRNDSTVAKGAPNSYSSQTLYQKKSQIGMAKQCPSTNNCRKPKKSHIQCVGR